MLERFRKVSNNLYRSSAPTPEDVKWLKEHFKITRIISLDQTAADKIKLVCGLLKIEHVILPIDFGKKTSLIHFLSEFDRLFEDEQKTLLHCYHGKDRSGLACAMYRCKFQGWSAEKAIKEADSLDFCTGLDPAVRSLYIQLIKDCEHKGEEDVNEVSDVSDQEAVSYAYPGAVSDNLSWAPLTDTIDNSLYTENPSYIDTLDTPNEFLNADIDFGGDGHGIPESGIMDGINSGIGGAGFSFPIPLTTI
jgi:hypothetical protein